MGSLMSRTKLFLILAIWASQTAIAGAPVIISPANPLIEYTGRIDFANPAAPRFSFSGVTVRAAFTGSSISILLDDELGTNYYTVVLDGIVQPKLHPAQGSQTYVVGTNLRGATHEVELFRLTEVDFGRTSFLGFAIDSGASIIPLFNPRPRLIEWIGNSITCGYGNEGVLGETFTPATENHYLTYAAFSSRNFGARHLSVSKSGIGVYRNNGGPVSGSTACMLNYYPRIFLYSASPIYNFSETPDLVCVDLGTNDFSYGGGDSSRFVNAFLKFVDTLQTRYDHPDVLLLVGPMLFDPDLRTVRNCLNLVASRRTNNGKGRVTVFEMSQQTGDLGLGIDYHPNVLQQARNGSEVTAYIAGLKGWRMVPAIAGAEVVTARHITASFSVGVEDSTGTFAGFSILSSGRLINLNSVQRDSLNPSILHLYLADAVGVGDSVLLDYQRTSIRSTGSGTGDGSLQSFRGFPLENNLTPTLLLSGSVDSTGRLVRITYSKSLKSSISISGVTVRTSQQVLPIDSSVVQRDTLLLYIHSTIGRGDSVSFSYSGTSIVGNDDVAAENVVNVPLINESVASPTSVDPQIPPFSFALAQNYPNPFNPRTTISFSLAHPSEINLSVYDILGRHIATLVEESLPAGKYNKQWDASDLAGGVYYYRLTSPQFSETRRLVLLK